jgi:hypothetical protein
MENQIKRAKKLGEEILEYCIEELGLYNCDHKKITNSIRVYLADNNKTRSIYFGEYPNEIERKFYAEEIVLSGNSMTLNGIKRTLDWVNESFTGFKEENAKSFRIENEKEKKKKIERLEQELLRLKSEGHE